MQNSQKKIIPSRMLLVFIDVVLINAVSLIALAVRFDFNLGSIPEIYLNSVIRYFPIDTAAVLVIFWSLHLYQSLWKFAGLAEMYKLIFGCALSVVVEMILMPVLGYSMPRSFYLLDFVLLICATGAVRTFVVLPGLLSKKTARSGYCPRVMIIGAGDAGSLIIKELLNSEHVNKIASCVIDDDFHKIGTFIHGIKVVGNRDDIIKYSKKYNIDEIILAIPSAGEKSVKEILDICKETKCTLKRLPGIYQMIDGVNINSLRNVSIEDLLGRVPATVNLNEISGYIKGKTVLVTGGGGSIGSELCRQIAGHDPRQLIILDVYENNAYDIQNELTSRHPELDLVVLIASIRDIERLNDIFDCYRPDIVYHAAAHKHVPLMEQSPTEAVKNNVFGTLNVVKVSDKYNIEKFVLLSTDKAVNPTNIMGASKRICEMIIQAYDKRSDTEFVAVRFGNVLGSAGSVVPLFKKQIEQGGPVTVTHPDIVRFFMSIPEAVSLVLQAGAYARGGEIFVLDMGEPVKILDLAVNLIRLSGHTPRADIKIKFIGLRPGEKLYEEILMDEEGLQKTKNKLIYVGQPVNIDQKKFFNHIGRLEKAVKEESAEIRPLVSQIVLTYSFKAAVEELHEEALPQSKSFQQKRHA